jgi:hypothetical protein
VDRVVTAGGIPGRVVRREHKSRDQTLCDYGPVKTRFRRFRIPKPFLTSDLPSFCSSILTGGWHRPALLLPRGRVLVLRGQGHHRLHRPIRPVLPGRRPDERRVHPDLRGVPHLGLHDQDSHGTYGVGEKGKQRPLHTDFLISRRRATQSLTGLPPSFFVTPHRRKSSTKRPRTDYSPERPESYQGVMGMRGALTSAL